MSGLALGLVLLSAVIHASWNLLAKRGMNQEVFIWLAQVVISVVLLPLGLFLLLRYPMDATGWVFVTGTVLLHIFYFFFLGRGYARADLSVVYPIARGMGPAVVPILGVRCWTKASRLLPLRASQRSWPAYTRSTGGGDSA